MIKKGIKYLLLLCALSSFSYAGLVDAVSMIVNNSPITLLEIRNYSQKFHIPSKEAVRILIQEKLEKALIKKDDLQASSLEIDNEIAKISQKAGISVKQFEDFLKKKGIDLKEYKRDLALKIEKRKLFKQITSDRIKRATGNEMRKFYKTNLNLFSIPQMIEVAQYSSKDRNTLKQMIKNPLINYKNITKKDTILKTKNLNPKLLYIFRSTKSNHFTPILTLNNFYMTFYIKKKINVKVIPYEKVKNQIFAQIMDKREKSIIKSYFDKLISKARIQVIRAPR